MLGLALDALVLCGLAALLKGGEFEGFGTGVLSALAISFATFMCAKFISPLLAIVVLVAAAFLVFWAVFSLSPGRAAIGAGVMLVYKIAIGFLFLALFS